MMLKTTLNVKMITENLADDLITGMQNASRIYIMTSFIMQSGVRLLAPQLKGAIERGVEVKVLTGDYLFVTQPEGLQALRDIGPRLEARLWHSMETSFHPKAYLFDYENGEGLLIVGSSNFSMSAMRMGVEWNLALNAKSEPYTFQVSLEKFMHNFYHDSMRPLNDNTISLYEEEYRTYHRKNPELIRTITEMEENEYRTENASDPVEDKVPEDEQASIHPRFA